MISILKLQIGLTFASEPKISLARARLCDNTECLLCDSGEDSCQHLFFQCPYSDKVRRYILVWLGLGITQQDSLSTTWRKWGRKFTSKQRRKVCYTIVAAMVYHLWKARNFSLWNAAVTHPQVTSKKVQLDVCGRFKSFVELNWSDDDKCWFHQLVSNCLS